MARRKVTAKPAASGTQDPVLGAALDHLRKKWGANVVCHASETEDVNIRRPTGLASLDHAMAGGFKHGTINVVSGNESVGKDALINIMIARNQRLYGKDSSVFIGYTEPTGWDKTWARQMGVVVPMSGVEIQAYEKTLGARLGEDMRAELTREAGRIYIAESSTAEEMFDAVLAHMPLCQLLVVNSISAVMPELYVDSEGFDPGSGLKRAQLVSEFTNKFTARKRRCGSDKPTVVCIQQARANLQQGGGWMTRKWTTQHGAHALRHMKTMEVELQTMGRIPERGEPLGKITRWTLTKAKSGAHEGTRGEYNLFFDSGPDIACDLFATLRRCDMVLQAGPVTRVMHNDKVLVEGKGADGVISKLRVDLELRDALYDALMATLPIPPLWRI